MKTFMKRMHGGQKGFTLIELLVVIAILGVIAAVVALNVAGFFGRGTLQAANTELHQVQTAVIAAMADGETGLLTEPAGNLTAVWDGDQDIIYIDVGADRFDAADYVYGPLRARYTINGYGEIESAVCDNTGGATGEWGTSIEWCGEYANWVVFGECP